MAWQRDRNDREVKTRGLLTHSQPSAINSNLHNTSHNEDPISRLVFSTCFDDVFRGNNGEIPYDDAAPVGNAGWSAPDWMVRTEAHRIAIATGLHRIERQAGSGRKTRYYVRWLKDRNISVSGIGQRYFSNSYDIAKRSYAWRQKGSYLTSKIPLFENWKWLSHFAKRRCHNAITHAWLRPWLGTWTIVESSPLTPVLCHRDRFIPGASHILNFRINVSLPGVYWPSVFLFPLLKLYGDAIIWYSKSVANPNSFSSFFTGSWFVLVHKV